MRPANGRYTAQDGDMRVENKGLERDIAERANGKWIFRKTIHWRLASELLPTSVYQRVGVRGITTYWRKVVR